MKKDIVENICALYICDLPDSLMDSSIMKQHFSRFAPVSRLYLSTKRKSCTVHFGSHDEADLARKRGTSLHGIKLNIFWSHSKSTESKVKRSRTESETTDKHSFKRSRVKTCENQVENVSSVPESSNIDGDENIHTSPLRQSQKYKRLTLSSEPSVFGKTYTEETQDQGKGIFQPSEPSSIEINSSPPDDSVDKQRKYAIKLAQKMVKNCKKKEYLFYKTKRSISQSEDTRPSQETDAGSKKREKYGSSDKYDSKRGKYSSSDKYDSKRDKYSSSDKYDSSSKRKGIHLELPEEVREELKIMGGMDMGGMDMMRVIERPQTWKAPSQESTALRWPKPESGKKMSSAIIQSVQQSVDGSRGESESDLCSVSVLELENILRQPATTDEAKYRVLDARDKLMQRKNGQAILSTRKNNYGTCPDMCPEKERYQRKVRHQLDFFETRFDTHKLKETYHHFAVKQYARSSADQQMPLSHDLRPVFVLRMTMNHLIRQFMDLVDNSEEGLGDWYHFLWDRTRSIRKDITQQEICDEDSVIILEQCARFHIFCCERMREEDLSVYDDKINTENLIKCLQTLKYMYSDLALKGVTCPNEAEFQAYKILLSLSNGSCMLEVQVLNENIQHSVPLRFAVQVYLALSTNNYVKFFKLVKSTTYLNACLLHRYFYQVRAQAMHIMVSAYCSGKRETAYPLMELQKVLLFDTIEETAEFCQYFHIRVNGEYAILQHVKKMHVSSTQMVLKRAQVAVECKRTCTVKEIVAGGLIPEDEFPLQLPHNSFDDHDILKLEAWNAEDQNANCTITDDIELVQDEEESFDKENDIISDVDIEEESDNITQYASAQIDIFVQDQPAQKREELVPQPLELTQCKESEPETVFEVHEVGSVSKDTQPHFEVMEDSMEDMNGVSENIVVEEEIVIDRTESLYSSDSSLTEDSVSSDTCMKDADNASGKPGLEMVAEDVRDASTVFFAVNVPQTLTDSSKCKEHSPPKEIISPVKPTLEVADSDDEEERVPSSVESHEKNGGGNNDEEEEIEWELPDEEPLEQWRCPPLQGDSNFPAWFSSMTLEEQAAELEIPGGAADFSFKERHFCTPFNYYMQVSPWPSIQRIHLERVIIDELYRRLQVLHMHEREMFWKLFLSLPDEEESPRYSESLCTWVDNLFQDENDKDDKALEEQAILRVARERTQYGYINTSVQRKQGSQESPEHLQGISGILFFISGDSKEILHRCHRLSKVLKQRHPLPLLPVAVLTDCSKSITEDTAWLNLLVENGTISQFKTFLRSNASEETTAHVVESALKWLASNAPQAPEIEMMPLEYLWERYVMDDLWGRLCYSASCDGESEEQVIENLISIHNSALETICELCLKGELFRYSTLAPEFTQFVQISEYPSRVFTNRIPPHNWGTSEYKERIRKVCSSAQLSSKLCLSRATDLTVTSFFEACVQAHPQLSAELNHAIWLLCQNSDYADKILWTHLIQALSAIHVAAILKHGGDKNLIVAIHKDDLFKFRTEHFSKYILLSEVIPDTQQEKITILDAFPTYTNIDDDIMKVSRSISNPECKQNANYELAHFSCDTKETDHRKFKERLSEIEEKLKENEIALKNDIAKYGLLPHRNRTASAKDIGEFVKTRTSLILHKCKKYKGIEIEDLIEPRQ